MPPLTGRVVDLAHVLPADVAASLANDLEAHETKTSNQVAVLILPSLEGEPLESFSHRVGTTWKLGQKGTENGVLLLVALRERKVRIEVGYGLEGTLTDLRSAHIIRQEIVPRFRNGDLPGGIAAGVHAILGTIEGTYKAEEVLSGHARSDQEPTAFQYVIIGIVVGTLAGIVLSHGLQRTRALLGSLLAFLVAQFASVGLGLLAAGVTAFLLWLILQANRGRGGGWGEGFMVGPGGGFGGSFGGGGGFSGGGGDFGGGGASGDW
ncbi:MAG: TPM domain-containing protein [Nitrospirota bacterium]|nr:TPM domain-containing protein [Nitrospirota bacterium]